MAVAFEDLNVNLALSSLWRGALVIEAVDLTKPQVRVVRFVDGTYSFQDIVERLTSGPPSQSGPLPRFAIYNIQMHDGRVEFDDRPEKAEHTVADLQIGVPFISSLPAEIDIRVAPRLSAKVNGAPFEIAGESTPFKDRHVATVRFDFDDLELAKYLASIRGPDSPPLKFKPQPRPTGDAAKVVFTEWDVPFANHADGLSWFDGSDWSEGAATSGSRDMSLHDVITDNYGNAWLTAFGSESKTAE